MELTLSIADSTFITLSRPLNHFLFVCSTLEMLKQPPSEEIFLISQGLGSNTYL